MADDGLSQLTDDEKTALAARLKRIVEGGRYPSSPPIFRTNPANRRRSAGPGRAGGFLTSPYA